MTTRTDDQDLSYLRDLAERGAKAPLLGGRHLVFWGALVSLAYLAHYAVVSGKTPFGAEALGVIWIGFGVIGASGSMILRRTMPTKPGSGSFGNLVEREVWGMVGVAISIYVIGLLGAIYSGAADFQIMDTIMAVALVLYAVAFAVTGRAAEIGWYRAVAFAALALGGISLSFMGQPELYLFGAASVLLVGFLPGLVLMLREPRAAHREA